MLECKNNPEKTSTTKVGKLTALGYSISTICIFDNKK